MTITSKSTDSVSKARASRNEAAKKEILKRIHSLTPPRDPTRWYVTTTASMTFPTTNFVRS